MLSHLATRYAKSVLRDDVEILYDNVWIHRLGQRYAIDAERFDYYHDAIADWEDRFRQAQLESADYWFHCYQPRVGDVIVDVGAGIGTDTMLFSKSAGPPGKVLAIEAHPATYRYLKTCCRLNRLSNVIALQVALMDRSGVVHIAGSAGAETNYVLPTAKGGRGIPVMGQSLDELCREHQIDRIDFLKINIEGAERFALAGMKDAIRRTRHVCIAAHDFLADQGDGFRTRELVSTFLSSNQFEIVIRENDPREYVRNHVHGIHRAK